MILVSHYISAVGPLNAKALNTEKANSGLMWYKHFTREKQAVTQAWI